eukprot:CAMPEP_0118818826 /NCGR_PEP_ID=MMETSP1162-20130426/6459_1 /TAXON_ID=33656 /ORGANISM="Phaeocystis Sp, Strain CCMP2710" /LENGTH=127 /DNA_ID=CAMNT_0006749053 /DNA_START=46 /DNA_END=426 /DNA_ORIENTATION=-
MRIPARVEDSEEEDGEGWEVSEVEQAQPDVDQVVGQVNRRERVEPSKAQAPQKQEHPRSGISAHRCRVIIDLHRGCQILESGELEGVARSFEWLHAKLDLVRLSRAAGFCSGWVLQLCLEVLPRHAH